MGIIMKRKFRMIMCFTMSGSIMQNKEFKKPDIGLLFFMLTKMLQQHRQLKQLACLCVTGNVNNQKEYSY